MRKNYAYTLIELLIVVTLAIIVFTVGLAGYRDFSRRQELTRVIKSLTQELRTIQQLALTGQKPNGVTCSKLVGYSFTRISSTNYRLNAVCDNTGTIVTHQTKSVTLPNSLSLTAVNNSFTFKVLGQGTDLTASNTITISNTFGNNYQVTIGTGGNIQ